jgi:hypothetical protein
MKTIICDIDGCLIEYEHKTLSGKITNENPKLCHGVIEKFHEWDLKSYNIILLTGRRESTRDQTEKQLRKLGLFWDQLVMGVGPGPRHLINDIKSDGTHTAFSYNLVRNEGLESLSI